MRPVINLLTLTLFLALASGSAWADDSTASTGKGEQSSNIEGWDVDMQEDQDDMTFFGMGFETRQAMTGQSAGNAAGAAGSSALGGIKKSSGPRRGK
jgi:hypothetical protein